MIEGLTGSDPIGCALSVGRKGPRGNPVDKDQFFLVSPRENEARIRPLHPALSAWNAQDPEQRKFIRGNIVHSTREQCFQYNLKKQTTNKNKMHPDRRPYCSGDGKKATRWNWTKDDPSDFREIDCPNERCQFRITEPPTCKPFVRLLFQLRGTEADMLCKYTSGGWRTASNLLGFFDSLDEAIKGLGVQSPRLFGFPFVLNVSTQTKASLRRSFPVVSMTPEMSPAEFFSRQADIMKQIGTLPDLPMIEQLPEYEDWESVNVNVPAAHKG